MNDELQERLPNPFNSEHCAAKTEASQTIIREASTSAPTLYPPITAAKWEANKNAVSFIPQMLASIHCRSLTRDCTQLCILDMTQTARRCSNFTIPNKEWYFFRKKGID